jgi:hypothetical protein
MSAVSTWAWGRRVCQGSFRGFQFSGWGRKSSSLTSWAWVTPAPVLTPGSPPAHATPALVAHAQGGLTLGPERGELAADFWFLGPQLRIHCE